MHRVSSFAVAFALLLLALGCSSDPATNSSDDAGNSASNASSDDGSTEDTYVWYMLAAPVAAEKEADLRAFCERICGSGLEQVREHGRRTGNKGEYLFLQKNPDGSMLLLVWQHITPDHMKRFLDSTDEYDVALIADIEGLTGMNFSEMMADPAFAPNEQVFSLEISSHDGTTPNAIAMPLVEGQTDAWIAACNELEGREDLVASRTRLGMAQESGWVQRTPNGDFALIGHRCSNPAGVMEAMWNSTDEFDVWFKTKFFPFHGIDPEGDMPAMEPNELLGEWWVD